MFASKDIYLTASTGGYQISRSVRLRSSASAYFNRTPASAGNRNTWTWSAWVKRGLLGSGQTMFVAYPSSIVYAYIGFTSSDQIRYASTNSGASLTTTPVYRDPSAWYHIVFVYDDTQATASNRLKLYVNGVQVTAFGTASYPTQNFGDYINSANVHNIGRFPSGVEYCDCYFSEMNFVDGQALTPSSFGEYNTITGVWQPKKYGGTYGTNGFYLNFSDNSASTATAIGKDSSGNGNNWTPNNISVTSGVTYDSMLDTPTPYADGGNGRGNYAVWNPAIPSQMAGGSATISNANLTVGDAGTSYGVSAQGSIAVTSGKWYWEVTASTVGGSYGGCGIRLSTLQGTDGAGYFYFSDGTKTTSIYSPGSAYGASYTSGDVLGIALDMDAGTLIFYKNGTSQGTAYTGLTGSFSACVGDGQNATAYVWNINFGQRPFVYTPPSGYVAVNTQNLPDSTITNGAQYMAATLYTANQTARNIVNSLNTTIGTTFQPDFVWIKSRSAAWSHALFDTVRGAGRWVRSNDTNTEPAQDLATLSSFNSDGFGLGANASGTAVNFATGDTYVAWQWKANGSAVTNTDGSISAQVNANPTAGFSVITYTGNATQGATVGHGLGVAPSMLIIKSRSLATDWIVQHKSAGTAPSKLALNATNAVVNSAPEWNNAGGTPTAFNSTVFTIAGSGYSVNNSGATYVAYCFAAVSGYSAFGSYTGNASTDGPFVYCGFKPRYILIKGSSVASSWYAFDTSRSTYNEDIIALCPSDSNTESSSLTSYGIDILSNGFKIKQPSGYGLNNSGQTYIYAAFAENPFKNALAR